METSNDKLNLNSDMVVKETLTEANPHIQNPDGLPVIKPLPESPNVPADGAVAICGQCGIRILKIMSYYCANPRCPTGLGGARVTL